MTYRILFFSLLMLGPLAVHAADERKIWSCSSFGEDARPIIYLVEWGNRSYIKFANVRIAAAHQAADSDQEWLWDNRNGYYNYSVSLGADNTATYYDFSDVSGGESAGATDRFRCRQIQ